MKKGVKHVICGAVGLVVVCGVAIYLLLPESVDVAKAVPQDLTEYVKEKGTIAANSTIDIYATVDGKLETVRYEVGDTVSPKDLLAEYNLTEYENAYDKATVNVTYYSDGYNATVAENNKAQARLNAAQTVAGNYQNKYTDLQNNLNVIDINLALKADSGSIQFMGKELSNATQEELTTYRRENIGFIFQSYNLISTLTASQNIDLIGEMVQEHLSSDEVLGLVGLQDKKNNYPSQLSGGQQQRVSIARALVKKPKLILADEPTSALDYATSIEVLSVLENVVKSGTTMVMVTHNEEITRMAHRVVRMRNGRTYDVTINRHPVPATELVW